MKALTQKYNYMKIADQLIVNLRTQHRPGDMLPSESQLSKEFNVTRTTIRRALDVLEEQDLVQRYHRQGTVVANPLQRGEFAIVIRPALMKAGASPYYREAAALLAGQICTCNNNAKWSAKLHLGQHTDSGQSFPATVDLLEPDVVKKLRGVFTFHSLYQLGESLVQKNIPVVMLGNGSEKYGATIVPDRERFYREASHHLRMAGCKTVGFIWNHMDRPLKPEERTDIVFAKCAIDAGLCVEEKWMPATLGDITESKGYDLFMKFWEEQSTRPDGIVIDDDVLTSGVLRAILHKQIRLPEQIRLVSHANKGAELPYHCSVTRYEFDISDIVNAAVDAMVKLVNGQGLECNRILLPGKLVKGSTT